MIRIGVSAFLIFAWPVLAAPSLDPPKFRLDGSAQPLGYAVDLTMVPGRDTFRGTVDIEIEVRKPLQTIWLNGSDLTVEEASFRSAGSPAEAATVAGSDQFVGFSLQHSVFGRGSLHIKYQGKLSRHSSAGIFQLMEAGDWYIYSWFQPTSARRAFPCFDEPGFKTPWQITLHVPENDMALSNTIVELESKEPNGLKAVRFKASPPLPSYLVALAVGPFQAVDAGRVGPTPVQVIVPRGKAAQAATAVRAVPQLLKLSEDYLGSPFPYEKLDMLAMPIGDSALGNVGLVTVPESILLAHPALESIQHQKELAETCSHQIANQWFGGLVTAEWWNDTWLNEGFATWMQRKIPAVWRPEWDFDLDVVQARLGAMRRDELPSARAVRQPILNNQDIASASDDITREKGAAVIEMLEHWINPERFRVGVQLYLKHHAGANATASDFASDMSISAAQDIAPILSGFLDQSGVPEISVKLKCDKTPTLELRQKRSQPIAAPAKSQVWRIPFCVAYVAGVGVHENCFVIDTPTADIELKEAQACPAWLLPNDDVSGYYQLAYEGDLLHRVLADNGRRLSVEERVGVLGELNLQVRAGKTPATAALARVLEFNNDPAPEVVEAAADLASLFMASSIPGQLREQGAQFIHQQFGKRARALGWLASPDDSDDTRLLRQKLVPLVASAGDKELIAQAEKLARAWLKDRQAITAEMSEPLLKVAAEFGHRDLFDLLRSAAIEEQDHAVRQELLNALASFRKPEQAAASLGLLLSNNFDPREAFYALLFGPLEYAETRDLPFQFVKQHLDALLKLVPREGGKDYASALPKVGRTFCDAKHRDELNGFFADRVKDWAGGPRILAQTLDEIDLCISARQKLAPELTAFLRQYR